MDNLLIIIAAILFFLFCIGLIRFFNQSQSIRTLLFFLVPIIIFFFVSYHFQRHFIYFPLKSTPNLQDFNATDMQIVPLDTVDNLVLYGWYKAPEFNKPVILFLHGNAGHIGYRMPIVRTLLERGFGIFLLEYRGYGGNKGSPSEQGLYNDARAAMTFLKKQKISEDTIVLYGESLGTGIATQLATENKVCLIILQSPFTSLEALRNYHYPWLVFPLKDHYDSLEKIGKIDTPLLILHGDKDSIVPYQQGKMLFHSAKFPKYLITFKDAGHNTLFLDHNLNEIIEKFSKKYCHGYTKDITG